MVRLGLRLSVSAMVVLGSGATALAAPVLELRGVQPGMNMAQAQAALRAAGFTAPPTLSSTTWKADDTRLTRFIPYGRKELEFDSTFAVMKRRVPNNWQLGEKVVVAFTPPPQGGRVWGVGQGSNYAPGTGPGAAVTVQALVQKFGQPSFNYNADFKINAGVARLSWYWDAGGRLLPASAQDNCRQAQHNTYLVNQLASVDLRGVNVVAEKADWFAGAVKAGCAHSLVAEMNFAPATKEVSYLEIKLVDFRTGYAAAQATFAAAQNANAAQNAVKGQQANQRRPDF